MTDLTRPVAGDPLSLSNGKASTVIIDEAFDVIEANEDAISARTSSTVITTDPYSDIAAVTYADGSSLTGWHGTNMSTVVPVGPLLTTIVGQTAVQADIKKVTSDITAALYLNLTEVGFASGVALTGMETFTVDILISEKTPSSAQTSTAYTAYAVTLASGTDMSGTLVQHPMTSFESSEWDMNEWHTITVPVGDLTVVRSIGIKKYTPTGSGGNSVRYNLTNVRKLAITPIDQALASQSSVAVVVPPSYPSTAPQNPILPDPLKTLVDFRPDHAWITGFDGVKNTRDWALDETGVTDVSIAMQAALDSLSPGDTLVMPSSAVYRCDLGLSFNIPNITVDGQGAALIQSPPINPDFIVIFPPYTVTGKQGNDSYNRRVDVTNEAKGLTIRNLRIFGAHVTRSTGSQFTPGVTPGSVSGTTMVLDGINESASFANTPGRDHTGQCRQDFKLSASQTVPGDCVITITDEAGVVLTTVTTPTLTPTPTLYTVNFRLRDLFIGTTATVTKATGTSNIITLTEMHTYNNCYTVGTATPWEFAAGVSIEPNATNITLENITVEGVLGDGLQIHNSEPAFEGQRTVVRNFFARGIGRQGIAFEGGRNHWLSDIFLLFCARHAVDIEPEFPETSALEDVHITNMVCWRSSLAGEFTVSSGLTFPRARRFHVDGLLTYGDSVGVTGGWKDSEFRNLDLRSSTPTGNQNSTITGRNNIFENVRIDGWLEIGNAATPPQEDENDVLWSPGNIEVRNLLFRKQVNGVPYLTVGIPGVHLENIRIADDVVIDQNYAVHSFQLLTDTTYTNLDLVPHRTLLPNSYPGVAIGQPWFPGGLSLKGNPLSHVRSLSGTTTKGNNLGRFQQAITAGSTTFTVAFPGKTYPNVTVTMAPTTGGSMALGIYHYRFAARNRFGGPVLAAADQTVTLSGSNNAVAVNVDGLYDAVTTLMAVEGLTIYRGVAGGASGAYSSRYDIVPTGDLVAWGGSGTGNSKRFPLKDIGTTIGPVTGTTASSTGFTFPYTAVAGTWTTAAGANAIVDESGWELDTNYAVFVETSWQTTYRVAARRRDGFDLEFGVAAPTGTNTVSWMIARF